MQTAYTSSYFSSLRCKNSSLSLRIVTSFWMQKVQYLGKYVITLSPLEYFMQLTKEQRTNLAALRKLIQSSDWSLIEQGMELLKSLKDPVLWGLLEEAISISQDGVLAIGEGEITKRVKSAYRESIALIVAENAGWFRYRSSIALSVQKRIIDLRGLSTLTQITELKICAWSLRDIHQLSKLTQLTSLDLSLCKSIQDLSPLQHLTQLTTLDLSGCKAVESLVPLENLTQLQSLSLKGVPIASDLKSLRKLTQLTTLDLSYVKSLSDLSPLSTLTNLENLDLSWSKSVRELSPLRSLRKLRSLNLQNGNKRISGREILRVTSILHHLTIKR